MYMYLRLLTLGPLCDWQWPVCHISASLWRNLKRNKLLKPSANYQLQKCYIWNNAFSLTQFQVSTHRRFVITGSLQWAWIFVRITRGERPRKPACTTCSYTCICMPQFLKSILFADDIHLFISHKDPHFLISALNCELIKLSKWFRANRLSLNWNKANFMEFKPRQNISSLNFNVVINERTIAQANETVFLGVVLDENLTWKSHYLA